MPEGASRATIQGAADALASARQAREKGETPDLSGDTPPRKNGNGSDNGEEPARRKNSTPPRDNRSDEGDDDPPDTGDADDLEDADDADAGEDIDANDDDESAGAGEDAREDDDGTELEDERERLVDLAELAPEMDLDDLYQLQVAVQVNGETKKVKLADVINGHAGGLNLQRRSEELSEQRRGYEKSVKEFNTKRETELQRVGDMTKVMGAVLLGPYHGRDEAAWAKLRESDPDKYTREAAQYQGVMTSIRNATAQLERLKVDAKKDVEKQFSEFRAKEFGWIRSEGIPAWAGDAEFEKGYGKVKTWLKKNGFSEADIDSIADRRLVMAAYKAERFDRLEASAPSIRKKLVRQGTKVVKRHVRGRQPVQTRGDNAAARFSEKPSVASGAALLAAKRKDREAAASRPRRR